MDYAKILKGDVAGHAFHGNQYTAGGGGGSDAGKTSALYSKLTVSRSNPNRYEDGTGKLMGTITVSSGGYLVSHAKSKESVTAPYGTDRNGAKALLQGMHDKFLSSDAGKAYMALNDRSPLPPPSAPRNNVAWGKAKPGNWS